MIKQAKSIIFFIILAVMIFVFESTIMFLLEHVFPVHGYLENFIDALLLMVLIVPFIYLFSYRPLLKQIDNNQRIYNDLMQVNEDSKINSINVQNVNQDLLKKTKELEDLNKFMVGRELKMVELKNKILELENKK